MGAGILGVWVDPAAGSEAAFDAWYNRQHLAERVGVPGFVEGIRYVALRGAPSRMAIYWTESPAVMQSPAYMARQNAPTEWTTASMKLFRNTVRTVFECSATAGMGHGGVAASWRFAPRPGAEAALAGWLGEVAVPALAAADGMLRCELWQVNREATGGDTVEKAMRPPDAVADWAILAEGMDAASVDAALAAHLPLAGLHQRGAAPAVAQGLYRYVFGLTHR